MPVPDPSVPHVKQLDPESQSWVDRLSPRHPEHQAAVDALHALLLSAARFEVNRRHAAVAHLRNSDQADLAQQSADDALVAVLQKLKDFRGDSRFTTWAYKFALLEAAVKLRRLSWQGREVPLEPAAWPLITDERTTPQQNVETQELFAALRSAIDTELSPHQREVLLAVTVHEVPIDVLAERLSTTRGALYKTLHDARRKLRASLTARGLRVEEYHGGRPS